MAEQMGMDWRSEQFRRKVITQIDEAIRSAATPMTKSSVEMENHVFLKAKSREEYLALVARLILHVKEMNLQKDKQQAVGVGGMPGQGMPPRAMSGAQIQDPLKSLQTLTMQGTSGLGPGQQPQGGMMQQQMMQLQQQQRQHQQLQQQRQQQIAAQLQAAGRPPLQRQDAFLVTSAQHVQSAAQPLPASSSSVGYSQPGMQTGGMQQRPGPPSQQMVNMIPPSQPSPFGPQGMAGPPQGQMDGQGIQTGGQAVPSPKPFMASPSPQAGIVPSPASRSQQPFSAPSPSSALNTPGNPNSQSQVSPAPRSHEEQAYLDKLNKLSKYIEPLRRMINKLSTNKDEERKKDISKMEGLLKILTDPSKRLPMQTLSKCEQVLEKLELSIKPPSVSATSTAPTPTVSTHMCHPLIEAVASHMQSPMFNHCLQQTFGPAISALYGSPIRAPSPPPKRKHEEVEEEDEDIPHILQGEIARLGSRFKVTLDPTQHSLSNAIHLLCKIDDKNLPSVPPISVTIPELYPEVSPECTTDADDYDTNAFLKLVQSTLSTQLLCMPNKFTFTELMDKWEMSIRRACVAATPS